MERAVISSGITSTSGSSVIPTQAQKPMPQMRGREARDHRDRHAVQPPEVREQQEEQRDDRDEQVVDDLEL